MKARLCSFVQEQRARNMSRRHTKGRIRTAILLFYLRFASRVSVAPLTVLFQSPAFFSSCTPTYAPSSPGIALRWRGRSGPQRVDLLFFREEGAQPLDACQQVDFPGDGPAYGLSANRNCRIVALSGSPDSTAAYLDIRNYGDLCKRSFRLEEEDPARPLLYGQTRVDAGRSRTASLSLETLLCAIRLNALRCDFSERPYAGHGFTHTSLILLYAGAEAIPLENPDASSGWLNPGFVDSLACARLSHPEMVLQPGLGPVGAVSQREPRTLYCYPNPATEDGLGQVRTRLVLEGTVGEHTCYYAIPLPVLRGGQVLELDITLLRIGTDSPDILAETGMYRMDIHPLAWEEAPAQTVCF